MERLETDWKRLYYAMPLRTVFHAYEAHVAYFDHLIAAPEKFRCLALTDGSHVRAICPLEARADRALGLPIPVWGTTWHPHWPVADVIGPEDEARRALLPALVQHLRRQPARRQLLVLGPLAEDSALWHGLERLNAKYSCAHAAGESHFLDCTRAYEEVAAEFSKRFRRHLRNQRKKLMSLPGALHVSASSSADINREYEAFLEVEASGWKGAAGTRSAVLLHPDLVRFYRELATISGPDDGCEINALYVDGHCIASQFCVRSGAHYTVLKAGFDERYARLGPGQLLKEDTLQRCCSDPSVDRLNLVSNAAWHYDWRPRSVPLRQVHVAIGPWCGPPLNTLFRFRYGPGRQAARWVRAKHIAGS